MKKIIFVFIFILSLGFSDGIVETNSFYSESLEQTRNFTIYLPEEYYNSDDDYPVVYFLHGFGGNNNSYNAMHSSLNSMMGNEIIDMIVVSADGSTDIYDGSFYTNSILNGDYEDYIAYDLVSHIDQNYRTKAAKEYRALSGHSMGGYGAFRLGLYHSDTFNSFASHSGPIHLESLNNPFLINAILIVNSPFFLMNSLGSKFRKKLSFLFRISCVISSGNIFLLLNFYLITYFLNIVLIHIKNYYNSGWKISYRSGW